MRRAAKVDVLSGDFSFRIGEYDAACDLVIAHHYSGRVPSNVQMVATMHEPGGLFGDRGDCVAACFFSIPPTRWSEEVWELSRLVAKPGFGGNLSALIAKAVSRVGIGANLLVSFADRTHGHHGGIYQACSWAYAGSREKRMDGVIIDGVFVAGRSCNSKYGTRSPKMLSEKLGREVIGHFDEGKHLYWKSTHNSGLKKAQRLGLASLPYPKEFADRPKDERLPRRLSAVQPRGSAPICAGER